ncbi:MAG: hypothetical protein JSS09_03145 [Verrucomicrobia bacterium]|nr:hypothetical protein [Verrucomicrobiota bacterium]
MSCFLSTTVDGSMLDFTKSIVAKNSSSSNLKDLMNDFFHEKGFLSESETLLEYGDTKEWFRAGGETYQSIGFIRYTEVDEGSDSVIKIRNVIAKSIASVDRHRGNSMLARRLDLKEAGLKVPDLYYVERSEDGERVTTFYEEYFPHAVELLSLVEGRKELSSLIAQEIAKIASVLDSKGYSNSNFIRDVIVDPKTESTYYIDFGCDLGEPSGVLTRTAKRSIEQLPKRSQILPFYHATSL